MMKRIGTRPTYLMIATLAFVGLGAIALRLAWATPGAGITSENIAGPVRLDDVDVRSESEINEIEIQNRGRSDIWVVRNTIVPGGNTGWHSHLGPSIVSVVSGTATNYHSDDPNTGHVYEAGSSFVDGGTHAHIVRNEGSTNLVLVAFQILPRGATRRIDQPEP